MHYQSSRQHISLPETVQNYRILALSTRAVKGKKGYSSVKITKSKILFMDIKKPDSRRREQSDFSFLFPAAICYI